MRIVRWVAIVLGAYVSRAMLLFAEIKPVRLDPRHQR